MNTRLLIGAACAAFALSSVSVQAASCGEDCPPPSCGEDECTPTPPPPPSLPDAPGQATHRSVSFFLTPGGNVVQGQTYQPNGVDTVYVFGQGAGTALTDAPYTQGDSSVSISATTDVSTATATAVSHQGSQYGRNDVSVGLGYGLKLTAANSSIADAIEAILAHAPLAAVSGAYGLSATGTGKGSVSAYSTFSGAGAAYNFFTSCGYSYSTGPCAPGNWSMNLGFKRGTEFADGDANSFYATFFMGATAESGGQCFPAACPGDATAFIDPSIAFNQQLQQYAGGFSLSGNNGLGNGGFVALAGNVPEPASWALMLGGFGLLGGAVRRRRVTFQTA